MAVSRPILYGGIALVAAVAFWATAPESSTTAKAQTKPKSGKSAKKGEVWNFPAEELALRFAKPAGAPRNIFRALIEPDKVAQIPVEDEQIRIPAALTNGESDWAYTGMVEVDGTRLALLENTSTKQGGYVREGEVWKKSRVVRIALGFITLANADGEEETVQRFHPNAVPKPKPLPDPGFRPMDMTPALRGPIGGQLNPSGPNTPTKAPGGGAEIAPGKTTLDTPGINLKPPQESNSPDQKDQTP